MRLAIVGSRGLRVSMGTLERYLPEGVTEIVSGGAVGIDTCAAQYAEKHGLPLRVFRPNYEAFGRSAPIKRNVEIVDYADMIFIFWDGRSAGSRFVIEYARKQGKLFQVFKLNM